MINMPPLRERREDIPLLVEHFLAKFSRVYNKPLTSVDSLALRRLMALPWPGNVRQLENMLEQATVVADTDVLTERDLFTQEGLVDASLSAAATYEPGLPLREVERRHIMRTLQKVRGNRTVAKSFEERFGQRVFEGYGLTETSPVVSVNLPEPKPTKPGDQVQLSSRPGSVGKMAPGIAAGQAPIVPPSPAAPAPIVIDPRTPPPPTIPSGPEPVVPIPVPETGRPAKTFDIRPSIGVSEEYSDNFNQTPTNKVSNFRSAVIPGLLVLVDLGLLTGEAAYYPTVFYDSSLDKADVNNAFSGQLTWQALPRFRGDSHPRVPGSGTELQRGGKAG